VSRIALLAISVAVGLVLAFGAVLTAQAILSSPGKPSSQPPYSYGSP
jgi:hypothetical protein